MRVPTVLSLLGCTFLFSANLASSQPIKARPEAPDSPGAWVNSDNGDLSLRLRVKSSPVATQESIVAIAEIRNNRSGPVTILRPFGDPYFAQAVQIKLWGERGQIKYTGPKYDYDLSAKAFVTLAANEIVADTLELSVRHFAGMSKTGTYALRYDYAYAGTWDKKVAGEGVKGIWHGAMCSREIQFEKKDAAANGPKPNQEQLNADLRTLNSLHTRLLEKPDDDTARDAAVVLATRLAPHLPGNQLVWEILVKTRALRDGMALADAEKLLGAATQKSDKSVGWYFNPHGKHVAPYLQARVSKEGLAEWRLSNR